MYSVFLVSQATLEQQMRTVCDLHLLGSSLLFNLNVRQLASVYESPI